MKRDCECCGRGLHPNGRAATGVCLFCRSAGAEFARRWAEDLRESGLQDAAIGDVIGVSANAVRARRSEHRRMATA